MIHPCGRRTDGRAIAYTRYSKYAVARIELDLSAEAELSRSTRTHREVNNEGFEIPSDYNVCEISVTVKRRRVVLFN